MDFARSNAGGRATASTKIVVAGGFGVGKTTLVGSVSEIKPLRTEALVTNESEGVDDLDAVPTKATTTVAMDFGRITLAEDLVLYLFGTPGQRRFWFMWDDLCRGAIGAIVLVDTARLNEAFSPLDYFEAKGIPFIVVRQRVRGHPEVPDAGDPRGPRPAQRGADHGRRRPRPGLGQVGARPGHRVRPRAAHQDGRRRPLTRRGSPSVTHRVGPDAVRAACGELRVVPALPGATGNQPPSTGRSVHPGGTPTPRTADPGSHGPRQARSSTPPPQGRHLPVHPSGAALHNPSTDLDVGLGVSPDRVVGPSRHS